VKQVKPVPQDPADQAILDRYREGDAEAIGELADRYASRLYNFGLRMCGVPQDAQDMVQDTFLNVIRYLESFRGETKLKNWLFRLASSACLKKRRGRNDPRRELPLEAVTPAQNGSADVPDWSTSPVRDLLDGELRAHLREAIRKLPPKYRLVFNLRDLEGFSTAETAEILGLTPQTVKTRLHRARAFLRLDLADYFQENEPVAGEQP